MGPLTRTVIFIERERDLFGNSLIIYINIYKYIIEESREEIARTKVASLLIWGSSVQGEWE